MFASGLAAAGRTSGSGVGGALAAVAVLEPDDVVELRRRDLEDRRVLERRDPVHGAGPVAERGARADDRLGERLVADGAELDPRAAGLDQPRLVLLSWNWSESDWPAATKSTLPT